MEGQQIEVGEPREFHVLDVIVGVITQPVRTLRRIVLIRPTPQALAVYMGIAVLEGLTSLTLPRPDLDSSVAGSPELSTGAAAILQTITTPTFLFGSTLVLSPLALLLETGVLFLVACRAPALRPRPIQRPPLYLCLRVGSAPDHGPGLRGAEPRRVSLRCQHDPVTPQLGGRDLGFRAAGAGDPGKLLFLNRPRDSRLPHPLRGDRPPLLHRRSPGRIADAERGQWAVSHHRWSIRS